MRIRRILNMENTNIGAALYCNAFTEGLDNYSIDVEKIIPCHSRLPWNPRRYDHKVHSSMLKSQFISCSTSLVKLQQLSISYAYCCYNQMTCDSLLLVECSHQRSQQISNLVSMYKDNHHPSQLYCQNCLIALAQNFQISYILLVC